MIKLSLSEKKVRQFCGKKHRNRLLIEKHLGLKIIIPKSKLMQKNSEEKVNDSSSEEKVNDSSSEEKLVNVCLKPIKPNSFSNRKWEIEVFRYVESASRGGFRKWFDSSEYENMEEEGLLYFLENNLAGVSQNYKVEIKQITVDSAETCICILPTSETPCNALEEAIKAIGRIIHSRYREIDKIFSERKKILKQKMPSRDESLRNLQSSEKYAYKSLSELKKISRRQCERKKVKNLDFSKKK
jgi:hypothetical protein